MTISQYEKKGQLPIDRTCATETLGLGMPDPAAAAAAAATAAAAAAAAGSIPDGAITEVTVGPADTIDAPTEDVAAAVEDAREPDIDCDNDDITPPEDVIPKGGSGPTDSPADTVAPWPAETVVVTDRLGTPDAGRGTDDKASAEVGTVGGAPGLIAADRNGSPTLVAIAFAPGADADTVTGEDKTPPRPPDPNAAEVETPCPWVVPACETEVTAADSEEEVDGTVIDAVTAAASAC